MIEREPSIHVTEKVLRKAIREVLAITEYELSEVIKKCSKTQLTHRKLDMKNDRVEKKAKMIVSSEKGDAQLFSALLVSVRRQLKHRGISQIKEGSKDWLMVKEVCSLANDFCESFEMNKREGYIEFIKIALSKMQKFGLNKINQMCSGISDTYAAKLEIAEDRYTDITAKLYQRYNMRVLERTGIAFTYKEDQPEKYVFFVQAAIICKELGIHPEIYIDSQLESFVFKDSIPDPAQLVGSKARGRAVQHLYNSGQRSQINNTESKVNFKAIKKC